MYQKKKDKRSIQSSEWIYDALTQLINEKDYSKITITDIVNKANVGRTTFYRNYETIDDVLKEKCLEIFQKFRQFSVKYYKDHSEESINFIKPFLLFWYDHSEIIELLIKSERESILKDCIRQEVVYFLNRSTFESDSMIYKHLNYFIEMRVANSMSILTEWINEGKKTSPEELASIIQSQTRESLACKIMF